MKQSHRRSGGSAGFNFHRTSAHAFRHQNIQDATALRPFGGALLVIVAAIGLLLVLASTAPASRGYADRAMPPAAQLW